MTSGGIPMAPKLPPRSRAARPILDPGPDRRRRGRALLAALALFALASEAGAQSAVFDHVATAANTSGRRTYISHPLIDGRPEAVFFVTHHWNPPGQAGVYNDHSIGVVYVGLSGQRWAITNRDGAAMPIGAAFTVWIPRAGTTGSFSFRHTTTAANTFANRTRIDHPAMNGNPGLYVNVTPVFESEEPDAEFGTWYEGSGADRWTIFRQSSLATMPLGLEFNVCVGSCGLDGMTWYTANVTCPANPDGSNVCTVLDFPALSHEDRLILSGGWDGVYLDDPSGIYWSSSPAGWGIFLENTASAMPEGAMFTIKATTGIYTNGFEHGDFFGWTLP